MMTAFIHSLAGGLLLLCLTSMYPPQTDILHKKISATYQKATLAEVLADLRKQYDLKFAYLNNELPTDQYFNVHFQDAPLREVLDVILENTSLSYQVMNGQVVLTKKPKQAKNQPSEKEADAKPSPLPPHSSTTTSPSTSGTSAPTASTDMTVLAEEEDSPVEPTAKPSAKPQDSEETEEDEVASEETVTEKETLEATTSEKAISANESLVPPPEAVEGQPYHKDSTVVAKQPAEVVPKVSSEESSNDLGQSETTDENPLSRKISQAIEDGLDFAIFDHLPDESPYKESPFHIGLIYPISSNGTQAGQYVNQMSLHLLVGYAAGLNGFEASALGNVENDFVDGVQLAGFFNLVKNRVDGLQAAGFLNLSGGELEGAQLAGFLNTHAGTMEGIQGAGFLNVTTDYTQGAQLAGFSNILTGDGDAIQGSGFANIATGDLKGAQFAGFGNYAYQIEGAQFAGFANIATGHVHGFQASGFINVARTVKGVQLSVFNVADSIDGVPIGFLSIVRKNGYRALEVWGSETLHANVALKIGVRKFYNIFSFGSQFGDTDFRYGLGYGIGTVTALAPTIDFSVDLLSQQIYEENNPIFKNNNRIDLSDRPQLNLLNTLRLGFSKQFSQHFGLFVAPTFNVFVSQVEQEDGSIGSDLTTPYTFFDQTYDGKTNLKMWVGGQVGLRF